MANIAIVYASTDGQTAKISERIATATRRYGHEPMLHDARQLPRDFTLAGFDAAIIGGSVHLGSHQLVIRKFVDRHRDFLEGVPAAFFSVSLAASQPSAGERRAREYVDRFLAQTRWRPDLTAIFAGALSYRQYGLFRRWLMRLVSRRVGHPTDTSRNHEFTDWGAVDAFAAEFSRMVESALTPQTRPPRPSKPHIHIIGRPEP